MSGGNSPLTAPADAGSRHPLETPAGTPAAPTSRAVGTTGVEPGAERLVRIVAGAIGVSAVIFGALSYDSFRAQAYEDTFWLSLTFWLLAFGLPTAFGLLSRWAPMRVLRAIALTQGVVFILLLVSWLLFRMHPLPAGADIPWAVTFTGLPTVSVAIVVRTRLAWAYTIVACVLSGLVRAETSAEPNPLLIGFEDGLYALLLMSVFVGLALAARRGAIQVSHAAALDRAAASESAARVARKQERLLIDALVHDSVISTLLSAGGGRADSRELARHAAHTLSQVDTLRRPSTGRVVTSGELERRLRQLTADIATDADFDTRLDADGPIPSEVAAAFVGAVQEALRNSVTYAGQDGRVVSRSVTARYVDGLRIEVRDDGAGFEPAEVRAERLGITRSILGRVNSLAGCCASVVSHPGAGTEVFLHWNGESAAVSAARNVRSPESVATPSAVGARSVPRGAAPAAVPLTGMFGLSTPIARLILGLFVAVHAVLAFSDQEPGFVLELGAFLCITAAAVWVTRAATDPLPRDRTIGILALLAVSEVLMCLQVPVVGASPFANWHLGAITLLLLILAVRGRPGWAWAGYAGLFAASVTWAVVSGLPAGAGVDLVIRHAGTLLAGTLFAVGLRGSLNALAALNTQLSRTEAAEATEIAAIEERQAQLARLNVIARPALERLADPHDLSDAERADCRLVEASLRDAIRARALFVEPVTSAARAARVRGVDVTLLDDSGDQPPADIDRVARIVADQLDSAASGRLIARVLPADRPVLATIVVEGAEHRMLAVTPAGDLRDA